MRLSIVVVARTIFPAKTFGGEKRLSQTVFAYSMAGWAESGCDSGFETVFRRRDFITPSSGLIHTDAGIRHVSDGRYCLGFAGLFSRKCVSLFGRPRPRQDLQREVSAEECSPKMDWVGVFRLKIGCPLPRKRYWAWVPLGWKSLKTSDGRLGNRSDILLGERSDVGRHAHDVHLYHESSITARPRER